MRHYSWVRMIEEAGHLQCIPYIVAFPFMILLGIFPVPVLVPRPMLSICWSFCCLFHSPLHGFFCSWAVVIFWPKYRLAHPENCLFSLSKNIFSGSKYPTNVLFNFGKRSTAHETESCPCHTASTIAIPHNTINHATLNQRTHVRCHISVSSHIPCLAMFSDVWSDDPSAHFNNASVWQTICRPVLPFSKLNKIFFGYFDPDNIFLDNKNK